MSRKAKTSLLFTILLLLASMKISSVMGADIGYYSGDFSYHRLFCKGNGFCSVHFGTNSAVGSICSKDLKSIHSSDFVSFDSQILTSFYLGGNFYAVCQGLSYDNPGKLDFMIYKGDSMSSMYLQYTKPSSFPTDSAAADSRLNIYTVEGSNLRSVSATTEKASLYTFDKNISFIANNDSLSFVAAASQNDVYVKSADASEFSHAATFSENINRITFLSDNYILCNGKYIIDVFGNYLGALSNSEYGSQGCFCDNGFCITYGNKVLKYDISLNLINEYNVSGTALDCAVCDGTIAVLTDENGKLCIFPLHDTADFENGNSFSSSSSKNTDSPNTKDSDKNTSNIKNNSSSCITNKSGDTDCSVIYITQGTTVAKLLKSNIFVNENVKFENYKGISISSGKLGTGATVTNSDSGDKYSVVLTGDITGEGNINSKDINNFCDLLVGNRTLTPAQKFAADVNKDGQIDLLDLLCESEITQGKYEPKY